MYLQTQEAVSFENARTALVMQGQERYTVTPLGNQIRSSEAGD